MTNRYYVEDAQRQSVQGNEPVRTLLEALSRLRFGAIQLTVHEGKLVQMDVTEKHRFS